MQNTVRSRTGEALAITAAWLAFMTGLLLGGEVEDPGSLAVAAVTGGMFAALGFAAASRCRQLAPRGGPDRRRLAMLALAIGTALGIANLLANWLIAAAHPAFRALLVERLTRLEPIDGLIAAPLVEEVAVRLFLMSGIAWVVSRFTGRATLVFGVALLESALVFAVLHLARPLPTDPGLANYYRAALVIKYTLAGVPLGWIFWRWGLPYAILCHVAANAAHLVLQDGVF